MNQGRPHPSSERYYCRRACIDGSPCQRRVPHPDVACRDHRGRPLAHAGQGDALTDASAGPKSNPGPGLSQGVNYPGEKPSVPPPPRRSPRSSAASAPAGPLAVAPTAASGADATATTEGGTGAVADAEGAFGALNERFGGESVVRDAVEGFRRAVLADDRVRGYFVDADPAAVDVSLRRFLDAVLGDRGEYAAQVVRDAYETRGFTTRDLALVASHLDGALASAGVPPAVRDTVLTRVAQLKLQFLAAGRPEE